MNEFRTLKRKLKQDLQGVIQELPRENETYVNTIFRTVEADLSLAQSKFNGLLNKERADELSNRLNTVTARKIYIFARDYLMQKYYNKLISEGIAPIRARHICSEKFYISEKGVQIVIYGKKNNVGAEHRSAQ